jgi:two-component system chemotaxis sensor kinase CheA
MGPVQDREEDLPGRQSPTAVEASDTATGDAGEAHHNHGPSQPAPRETKATETTALPPSPAGADHGRIKTLSIASDQLDRLVDYVGELTMAQSRLSRISTTLHNDQLHSAVEEMERFSVALKGLVLGMRMIPLRTTFMKFRRTIRDLGEQLGKQAELVLEGEDTELDKSVIEELNVPLVHLVRNAMDHGIEPPGQRLAAGKPPRGRIRLTAQHAGNEVHVTLQDDGRGIDTQGLLRTAIDRGIVPPDKQLNQQELLELIYCPGLSESVEVNMVSGRGIGMPAVREAIAAMRGRVDVSSSHGQGTTFQIRLPLSLAIVDCLHLRAADVNFFVQIENVEECIDTTGSSSDFHKGKRTFGFRGKIYPLICLREYFHLGGALSNPSQIVLTRVGEERVGLLVDNVMDQKQAVLKKLGRLFGNVRGIMGCAQMDDGRLAMFLDLSEMVRSTEK